MMQSDPKMEQAFLEYAALGLRHHLLAVEGKEDSEEMSEIEDRMDNIWPRLDEAQRRSLKGMASDLNWVRRKGEPPPKGRKEPTEVGATDRQELADAMKSNAWHRILSSLRLCAPVFPSVFLARERGVAYDAIGLKDYARIFNDLVVELTGGSSGAISNVGNRAGYMDARATEFTRTNTVVVSVPNGVRPTEQTADDRLGGAVSYQPCAA